MLEGLWFINVIISEASLQGNTAHSVGVLRSNVSIAGVGEKELHIPSPGPEHSLITAKISLRGNGSGVLEMGDLASCLDPDAFLFEVRGTIHFIYGHMVDKQFN